MSRLVLKGHTFVPTSILGRSNLSVGVSSALSLLGRLRVYVRRALLDSNRAVGYRQRVSRSLSKEGRGSNLGCAGRHKVLANGSKSLTSNSRAGGSRHAPYR